MTRLSGDDFAEFFAQINEFEPFQWQSRLLQFVVDTGRWPDVIAAPTGSGKSSVVDVHIFANALYGCDAGPRVPRRLAVVVGRRAIVDSHHEHALAIQRKLRESAPDTVAGRVAANLHRLRARSLVDTPFSVSLLRGEVPADSNWIDDPSACGVICATPDMFGSRLLFGGYGSSRAAWPREAGTLARDTVMVLDEAHLNEQLLYTTRRVGQLQSERDLAAPAIHAVATTATPAAGDGVTLGVERSDLAIDSLLRNRLEKPKPVELVSTANWPGDRRPSHNYAKELARLVLRQVTAHDGIGSVGCIVNSVSTAQEVARLLRAEIGNSAVIRWVGPMRPLDLKRLQERHREVFTTAGDREIRVIVATQTLEVGVDIDLVSLVTELAPGSSIAQRAGRVNRLGRRENGECVVVVPQSSPSARSGPYEQSELVESYEWLQRRTLDPDGLAPSALVDDPPPARASRRPVLSRIEVGTDRYLASSAESQVGEIDLKHWIHDDLADEELGVGIVCRAPLPADDVAALALLRETPISRDEVYPTRIGTARRVVDDVVLDAKPPFARVFRLRAGELEILDLSDSRADVRPGDVLIVDGVHRITDDGVITLSDGMAPEITAWGGAGEVLRVLVDGHGTDRIALRDLTAAMASASEDPPEGMTSEQAEQAAAVEFMAELIDMEGLIDACEDLQIKVTVPPLPDDVQARVGWAVATRTDADKSDEESRQTWVGSPVSLDGHQAAVAERGRDLAVTLGLDEFFVDVLYDAGRLHDEGKRHTAFQQILSAEPGEVLAKSRGRDAGVPLRKRVRVDLARGWRHEQLSVVYAADQLAASPADYRDLVLRLVGSSHGRGRSGFVHSAPDVLAGETPELSDTATELFDEGAWEELVEATDRRWGIWECAYLEAVLRAADCMVSKEGS